MQAACANANVKSWGPHLILFNHLADSFYHRLLSIIFERHPSVMRQSAYASYTRMSRPGAVCGPTHGTPHKLDNCKHNIPHSDLGLIPNYDPMLNLILFQPFTRSNKKTKYIVYKKDALETGRTFSKQLGQTSLTTRLSRCLPLRHHVSFERKTYSGLYSGG